MVFCCFSVWSSRLLKVKQRSETTLSIAQPVIPFLFKALAHTTARKGAVQKVSVMKIAMLFYLSRVELSRNYTWSTKVVLQISYLDI